MPEIFLSELVVNWHIVENCNYRCNYCYAKWGAGKSIIKNEFSRIIDEIGRLRNSHVCANNCDFRVGSVRLNFAGGEPFLVKNLPEIIAHTERSGLETSFISNGSLTTDDFIDRCARKLSVAGFSFDSNSPEVIASIGRIDRRSNSLSAERLLSIADRIRSISPRTKIKINTVVCQENSEEDMNEFLAYLRPDKWKVLRVLPVIGAKPISDKKFRDFVDRHLAVPGMVVEDNCDMRGSYLMIDPQGRFYQNLVDGGYSYSDPIHEVGVFTAIRQINFLPERFLRRYAKTLAA